MKKATFHLSLLPVLMLHPAWGAEVGLEAGRALKQITLAPGLSASVFASEPQLENPVSLDVNGNGDVYVVESGRRRSSVYDIRNHPEWLEADLQFLSVEDRADFLRRTLVAGNGKISDKIRNDLNQDGVFDWHDLEVETESVRLLRDTDGDGVADESITYAEGFDSLVSGVAAGGLADGEDIWFACVPDLWLLRDTDGDGKADERESLFGGFGVHIAYGGHDLHGLTIGPDGRLYFSIADRGARIEANGRVYSVPHQGAVFRCETDGSGFEVYATGFRNPQELAFDQNGNLFTGDNNADGGDKARFTYVMDGGEYGWHYGWQHLSKLGAWNSEKLWHLAPTNTAAYIVPPVAHISNGPSGLAFYPGTGLGTDFLNRFLLCDFKGAAASSGIHSFAVASSGAGFELIQQDRFLWNLLVTDVAFAPDGSVLVSDWIHGWDKPGKGRVYRVSNPALAGDPLVRETREILNEGFRERSYGDLGDLLGHPDRRVRLGAQRELAARGIDRTRVKRGLFEIRSIGKRASAELTRAARRGKTLQERLHGIWGMGQISRRKADTGLIDLLKLLRDDEPEIRAHTARVMADARYAPALRWVVGLLEDPSPRVRCFAAEALGRYQDPRAVEPILNMVRQFGADDPYIRHAVAAALSRIGDMDKLVVASADPSPAVRMVSVLALRRRGSSEVALFLKDQDPYIVAEAARAINDLPLENSMPELARMVLASRTVVGDSLREQENAAIMLKGSVQMWTQFADATANRVMNAAFREGKDEYATALSQVAANRLIPADQRTFALQLLGDWGEPGNRDRITGLWRPLPSRDSVSARNALGVVINQVLFAREEEVKLAAISAAEKLGVRNIGEALGGLVGDASQSSSVRRASLDAMAALKLQGLDEAVQAALASGKDVLVKAARRAQATYGAGRGIQLLAKTMKEGSAAEKQVALQLLAKQRGEEAEEIATAQWKRLLDGSAEPGIRLEIVELMQALSEGNPALAAKLEARDKALFEKGQTELFKDALVGGDASLGKKVFYERQDIACFRCHKMNGEGGEVGPELSGLMKKHDRKYILESIVEPNKVITPGYENVNLTLKDGRFITGMVKEETDEILRVLSAEDGEVTVSKGEIEERQKGLSSMIPGIAYMLSKRELRDLIEFLATQ